MFETNTERNETQGMMAMAALAVLIMTSAVIVFVGSCIWLLTPSHKRFSAGADSISRTQSPSSEGGGDENTTPLAPAPTLREENTR